MKYLLPLFLGLFFILSDSVSYAQAPREHYDWSSTLTKKTNVLGAKTSVLGESVEAASVYQFDTYLLGGNLTPSSPFYFIKPFQENVQLTFTFDPQKKDDMRLAIAGERVVEMQQLAETNPNALNSAVSSYDSYMRELTANLRQKGQQGQDVSALLTKVEEQTAKQNIILEEVTIKIPDATQPVAKRAVEANWEGIDTVADIKSRPAVPPDVVDRLQALKAQGLLTDEEVIKLVNAKTRSEAREELQKYVNEGIVPEADFIRLNENVKAFYPDDFNQIHEVKRFYELQRLESEKPDDTTLKKIQEYAKTYKPGDTVPADFRKYWVPVVRLEEIQNTLRPDLIDDSLIRNKQGDYNKYKEVVERFKPRPEDLAFLENYLKGNPNSTLPPEYERMRELGKRYGAQCGAGQRWVPQPQSGGFCVPEGNTTVTDLPRIENFAKGKSCAGGITAAKGPGGVCSAYPSDCIPPGWSATTTCVETPAVFVTQNNRTNRQISCSSNSHFVPVPYLPDGGYCIANVTPVDSTNQGGPEVAACPLGFHRNYPGGPCFPDDSTTYIRPSLPRLTSNPGDYPSPFYTSRQCGAGYRWVADVVNPSGGYCAPDSYVPPINVGGPQPTFAPKTDMGKCRTAGECYDFCKENPTAASCKGFNPSGPRPGDSGSRESQEAGCRSAGGSCDWSGGSCNCKGYKVPTGVPGSPTGSPIVCQLYCPNGQYQDSSSCACRKSEDYPSRCSYPSQGCGSGKYWDYGSCSCKSNDSQPPSPSTCSNYSSGMCGSSGWFDWGSCSCKQSTTNPNPPPGYGTCADGQEWNGSYCQTRSTGSGSNPPPPPSGTTPPSTYSQPPSYTPPSSYQQQTPPPPSNYQQQPPPPPSSYEQQSPPPPSSYSPPPPPSSYEAPPPPSSYEQHPPGVYGVAKSRNFLEILWDNLFGSK